MAEAPCSGREGHEGHEGQASLSDRLRDALRKMASTVTVLASGLGEDSVAMTATAFCPVSLQPRPTVLVCVNKSARLHAATSRTGGFRVHVLAEDQIANAKVCGGGELDLRFRTGEWTRDQWPGPRLSDCLFDMVCRTHDVVDCGTHSIFFGEVQELKAGRGRPLIYVDGTYGRAAPLE